MYYHLILTERCNLRCKYCYEKSLNEFDNGLEKKFNFDFSEPSELKIDLGKLKSFLSKDKDPSLIFYGGEPLLKINLIKKIIKEVKANFHIQTNGILLNLLGEDELKKISKILVSLDGGKKITNHNRGQGVFEKVLGNICLIKKRGFKGEVIARMTVSTEFPDVFRSVKELLDAGFSSIHYQLDAGFYKTDYEEKKTSNFFKNYNESVKILIDFWLGELEKGKVIRIYPFLGIVESILSGERAKLRCGAGHSGYAITTGGTIVACPIMNNIKDFKCGTLETEPKNLKKFKIKGCENCEVKDLCGGRCLYWKEAKLWPKKGDEMICNSIRFYINYLKEKMPKIEKLIEKGVISKNDFDYEKYFGPEIIP